MDDYVQNVFVFFMPLGSSCCQVFFMKKGQIRGNKCKL
nr:MAG TPA: hypothetical protein [Caudoviricetes sp.]